ncbi:NAD(P)H:quinone oxidoreductase [Jatrophihabitans sp. YIM 134969]
MADRPVKVAIIFYSSTGTIYEMAKTAEQSAKDAGAEVRLVRARELAPAEAVASNPAWEANARQMESDGVAEATPDDIEWADVVLFGTPTRYGAVAAQLKQYIDGLGPLWAQGKLADKVYAGFTSSSTAHGGQESTLLTLYNNVIHFGGIIVPPGYTHPSKFVDGNPYGASHVAGQGDKPVDDTTRQAVRHETERAISVGAKLIAGS